MDRGRPKEGQVEQNGREGGGVGNRALEISPKLMPSGVRVSTQEKQKTLPEMKLPTGKKVEIKIVLNHHLTLHLYLFP